MDWTIYSQFSHHNLESRSTTTQLRGYHELNITKIEIGDKVVAATTPSNRGNENIESRSSLTIIPVEEPPRIGNVLHVNCSVRKGCKIVIPYQHVGVRKSELRLECKFEGRDVILRNIFNVTKTYDTFQLIMKYPKLNNSGSYSINLTNNKGSDEAKIKISIIDRPSAPQNLTVADVQHDSLKLKWISPRFIHGSNISKYIIRVCIFNFFSKVMIIKSLIALRCYCEYMLTIFIQLILCCSIAFR